MKLSQILGAVTLAQLTSASTIPRARNQRRQMNTFNPDHAAGFDDPTINIADPILW
jgi:hypothetical protein